MEKNTWWPKSVEETIENIDALVHKRMKLIKEYFTIKASLGNNYEGELFNFISGNRRKGNSISYEEMYQINQNHEKTSQKYLKKIEKIGQQIFRELSPLYASISDFHMYLYLMSCFLFSTNKRLDLELVTVQAPVIPDRYSFQSSIKEIFDEDEIEKLENIFFNGLKTFNDLVFLENHFVVSDGTVFFDEYWEEIKKNVTADIYKIVNHIGIILESYYLYNITEYNNTIYNVKEYINNNISGYKCVDIDIKEIGRDKTQYRAYQVYHDVNCGYGCNIY